MNPLRLRFAATLCALVLPTMLVIPAKAGIHLDFLSMKPKAQSIPGSASHFLDDVENQSLPDGANLLAIIAAEQTRDPSPRFERSAFTVQPSVTQAVLSPDGSRVAWLRGQGDNHSVWVMPTSGGEPRQLQGASSTQALSWSHDGRWLFAESPGRLAALAVDDQRGSRLITELGGLEARRFVAVDPVHAAAAIVIERSPATIERAESWRLLRVDAHGQRTLLHEDTHKVSDFAFDATGRLAFLQRVEGAALATWRVDAHNELHALLRCENLHRCSLLSRTNPDGKLLLRNDLDHDLWHLSTVGDDGSLHTMHIDPERVADLDSLVLDRTNGQPLVASYRSIVPANIGLTTETRDDLATISARFPNRNLALQYGGDHWLIAERGGSLQGERWHLYDSATGMFTAIPNQSPVTERGAKPAEWLPEDAMAHKIPVLWTASDGMRIHGFLSLPPGHDPASLPLLAMIHGGPWNRVSPERFGAGYTQMLANRGYIVFEPNFRASTGYGRDYVFAAHGDFGNGRVQQDIDEGVRWLLDQGIGDPDRVGIAGASFGGYATLLGVTFQPDLFKVGVAMVPVADFGWNLRWNARSQEALNLSPYIPFTDWLRMLSLDVNDPETMTRLHQQSPLANAKRMNRPLLIFASGKDHRVAIRGVLGYAAKLKLLGKDFSLYVDDQAGHGNDAPLAHEAYLYLLALMLHQHLGGAEPTPPDPELARYLERTQRIAGPFTQASERQEQRKHL